MSHIDRLLLIYDGSTHGTMVIPFWHSFKRKTINTLLSLDEDGTAPISELKLLSLYQQSLRELIKQDGERIVLIMRYGPEIATICGESQNNQNKDKIFQLFW